MSSCANSFAAPVVKIQKERGQTVITTGPYAIVRHLLYFGALFYMAATSLVLSSWWGFATVPLVAFGLAVRIGVEERCCVKAFKAIMTTRAAFAGASFPLSGSPSAAVPAARILSS
jgi:protein-S-isoprenylcysteine O-methyltransferase Ste14